MRDLGNPAAAGWRYMSEDLALTAQPRAAGRVDFDWLGLQKT